MNYDSALYACVYVEGSFQVCPLEEVVMVNALQLAQGKSAQGIVFFFTSDHNVAEYVCDRVRKMSPWGCRNA